MPTFPDDLHARPMRLERLCPLANAVLLVALATSSSCSEQPRRAAGAGESSNASHSVLLHEVRTAGAYTDSFRIARFSDAQGEIERLAPMTYEEALRRYGAEVDWLSSARPAGQAFVVWRSDTRPICIAYCRKVRGQQGDSDETIYAYAVCDLQAQQVIRWIRSEYFGFATADSVYFWGFPLESDASEVERFLDVFRYDIATSSTETVVENATTPLYDEASGTMVAVSPSGETTAGSNLIRFSLAGETLAELSSHTVTGNPMWGGALCDGWAYIAGANTYKYGRSGGYWAVVELNSGSVTRKWDDAPALVVLRDLEQ